jgi:hypothetical protein
VWKAALKTIDALPVESVCYKLRVHDSLEAIEEALAERFLRARDDPLQQEARCVRAFPPPLRAPRST